MVARVSRRSHVKTTHRSSRRTGRGRTNRVVVKKTLKKTNSSLKTFFSVYIENIDRWRRNWLKRRRKLQRGLRQKQATVKRFLGRYKKSVRKQRSFQVTKPSGLVFERQFFPSWISWPARVIFLILVWLWHQRLFIIMASLAVAILAGSNWIYVNILADLPSPSQLVEKKTLQTTTILDRYGTVLYRIYQDENRIMVPLSQIPPHVIQATLAIEDQSFYDHHGLSLKGIMRALWSNSHRTSLQGGSTITQQLVKIRLLSFERTLQRKIREGILAILVEGAYSKDEILEMYLNQVSYGGTTHGIEAAAQTYFNKPARELTIAEGALLAGLPAAPSVYNPFGATPELGKERQTAVLNRMVEDGYLTPEEAEEAKRAPLVFNANRTDIRAPHFVMYVRKLLADTYGEEILNTGGLIVRTTLDLPLHNQTQDTVTREVASLERLRITNGAALITNPQTGEVLSMVGSTDYFNFARDGQVNVTLRPRQPGSSIKPLTYALAFEENKSPWSTIDDTPITYLIPGSKPYTPKNYDGQFRGRVTLREALASSYNVPAVKLLAELGVTNLIDKGQSLGISTWQDRQRFGLSLTLGGGEVTMLDMTKVYGTFANGGETVELNPILEITDATGRVWYRNTCALDHQLCPATQTVEPRVATYITDILKDNQARTPAFGPFSVLTIPNQEVAVKTGTTNNLRDNWTIGYTTDRVVAVWVGNNDNQPMSYVASGITGASPIWNILMRSVLNEQQPHFFHDPTGLIKVSICAQTGTLPCQSCPTIREELFVPGTEPTQACFPEQFIRPTPSPNLLREQLTPGIQTQVVPYQPR